MHSFILKKTVLGPCITGYTGAFLLMGPKPHNSHICVHNVIYLFVNVYCVCSYPVHVLGTKPPRSIKPSDAPDVSYFSLIALQL